MKKLNRVFLTIVLLSISILTIQAQKSNSTKTLTDTSGKALVTKMDKAQADADNYVRMAQEAKNKFKLLFPSRPGDTVYAVIAGIDYRDPNLKILKQKMDAVKHTKGLTSSYHDGTAIIKICYKQGTASALYDNLDDDIKDLFAIEDMDGSRIILSYKSAKTIKQPNEKSFQ